MNELEAVEFAEAEAENWRVTAERRRAEYEAKKGDA